MAKLALRLLASFVVAIGAGPAAWAQAGLDETWPSVGSELPDAVAVRFESADPFTLREAGDPGLPARQVEARLYLPATAQPSAPAPAVIFLHGAGGVQQVREVAYARQLAAQGVAAMVIDVFGNRRDIATGFIQRVLNITEAMYLADAFAGLRYLAGRDDVDGSRVALIGFSYGGMAATYAAYRQVAELYQPGGPWFAAHIAYYAPCIAEFDSNETTGRPVLMMWGSADAIVDPVRCDATADGLRAGGSAVETVTFDGAFHQWDGGFSVPRTIGRDLSPCAFRVGTDATIRDARLGLVMSGPLTRRAILAACVRNEPYMIGADDRVRILSTAVLSRFLNALFWP